MFIQKSTFLFFLIIFFPAFCMAQSMAISKIDVADLERHLTYISSDKLQGRQLGTEINGLNMAANYLAEQAEQIGLKPAVDGYFQNLVLTMTTTGENDFLEIKNGKNKSEFRTNSVIALSGGTKRIEFDKEQLVFAGFGSADSILNVSTLDLNEKIVIVSQGNTKLFLEGKQFRWNHRLEGKKISCLSEQKPKAILFITNPKDKLSTTFNQLKGWMKRDKYELKSKNENLNTIPVLIALPEFADHLLGGKGKWEKYLKNITKKKRNNPVSIKNKTIQLNVEISSKQVNTKNVIGIIEGSDAEIKNEYVVFMAHYDHLGIGKNGDVYNGADDNGSGIVTLLEVAEAFSSLEIKPKRSIVFLWVTGEEINMLGSKYYTENPVFPLNKTKACINIDMDGRVYEPRDSVWKTSPKLVKDFDGLYTLSNDVWPELKEINKKTCEQLGLIPDSSLPSYFLRSSDHYHFHKNNVPILNYATGYHADYHKVGDEVSKINFEKIKRVADLCFLVGLEIANRENINFETPKSE